MIPPRSVLIDWVKASGGKTYAIGKIGDIFSMRNIDHNFTGSDLDLMAQLQKQIKSAEDGSLTFAILLNSIACWAPTGPNRLCKSTRMVRYRNSFSCMQPVRR